LAAGSLGGVGEGLWFTDSSHLKAVFFVSYVVPFFARKENKIKKTKRGWA
jgi:hypothetical protein